MDFAQGIHQRFVGHGFDQVTRRSSGQGLVDVLVALVGGQHHAVGGGILAANHPQGFQAAHPRQSQIHQGDVGVVLPEHAHGIFSGTRLGADHHVLLRVDDRHDSQTHDGVIVHHQNAEFARSAHEFSTIPSFSAAADLTGTSTSNSVPLPGALRISKRPPRRSVRSRIPTSPKCSPTAENALWGFESAAIVEHAQLNPVVGEMHPDAHLLGLGMPHGIIYGFPGHHQNIVLHRGVQSHRPSGGLTADWHAGSITGLLRHPVQQGADLGP